MSEKYTNPVKKMIPSKLETGFQQFLYKHVGKHIPKSLTPNDVTLIGALGGLFAVVSTLLANVSPLFFIGTLLGLAIHLVADDLDGYVARSRGMSSRAGAYFDLITDVLFSTFLILSFGLTPYCNMAVAAFGAPLYGVMNVTMMNYIIYFNESGSYIYIFHDLQVNSRQCFNFRNACIVIGLVGIIFCTGYINSVCNVSNRYHFGYNNQLTPVIFV